MHIICCKKQSNIPMNKETRTESELHKYFTALLCSLFQRFIIIELFCYHFWYSHYLKLQFLIISFLNFLGFLHFIDRIVYCLHLLGCFNCMKFLFPKVLFKSIYDEFDTLTLNYNCVLPFKCLTFCFSIYVVGKIVDLKFDF